jgi:spore coat polysaccharide biosynthesis protein SpsF
MKIKAVVQARMGSTRLPKKIMTDICGKPLISHIIEILKTVKKISEIIIASSVEQDNDILENFININYNNIPVIRGDENNVLSRFYLCEKKFKSYYTLRITGDNPLLSYELAENLIEHALKNDTDYSAVSSSITGIGCEIYKSNELINFYSENLPEYCKEHVTPYFYEHPEKYKISNYVPDLPEKSYRLTIDTEQDLKVIKKIFSSIYRNKPVKLDELLEFCNNNETIFLVNKDIKQKHYKE